MKNDDLKLQEIHKFVKSVMVNNDPSHDYSHVERVLNTARCLYKKYEGADRFLTEAIALLHDINDDKLLSRISYNSLEEFLQKQELSSEQIRFVLEGINTISFRKQPSLPLDAPIEVKIVQDADRIDAIGAIGIARAFAFSGHKGYPIGTTEPKSTIKHFDEKLFLLYDLLNTEEAKIIAKKRADFLHSFYDEFMLEVKGF